MIVVLSSCDSSEIAVVDDTYPSYVIVERPYYNNWYYNYRVPYWDYPYRYWVKPLPPRPPKPLNIPPMNPPRKPFKPSPNPNDNFNNRPRTFGNGNFGGSRNRITPNNPPRTNNGGHFGGRR